MTSENITQAMSRWARSCALCHVNGEGGAPRVGDLENWQVRMQQGANVLLEHTLSGYNKMPPLGYCMDCTQDDFIYLIEFMSTAGHNLDE